jgi:hypothetical protein
MDNKTKSILFGLTSIFLIVGCFNVSYSYFNFLKSLIVVISILGFIWFDNPFFRVLFVLVGILYNPAFPIYLNDKMTWVYLDVVLSGVLLERSLKLKQGKTE